MSHEDFRLPSTAGFMPGEDDLTEEANHQAYNQYSNAVTALVEQAATAGEPIFRTLYQEAPDFRMVMGILSIATTSDATRADAVRALDTIDREQIRQRGEDGTRDVNEFYDGLPTVDSRSGLGWRTQFDTEDDRWSDPALPPILLDSDQKKANEQLMAATRGSLKKGQDSTWGDEAHGGNQSGQFDTDSLLRGAKSYEDHPGTLILLHVARALYNYAVAKLGKVTEVQTLCVGSRIVVCANESLATAFLGTFKSEQSGTLLGLIQKVVGKPAKYGYRAANKGEPYQVLKFSHELSMRELARLQPAEAAQVIAEAADTDEEGVVRSVVDAVEAGKTWQVGTYDEAIVWLRSADTQHGVFWMDPPTAKGCHAEGALVALLVASGLTEKALIAGTMRPCTGCYLTLRYARERLGVALLGAPTHNGGFWETTQLSGMLALVNAYNQGQLKDVLQSPGVDLATRQRVTTAFQLEGVAAFCRFIERNFPESTNASSLLSLVTEPQPKLVPDTPFRRTVTLPESHMRQYLAEKAAKEAAAAKKEEEEEEEEPTPSGQVATSRTGDEEEEEPMVPGRASMEDEEEEDTTGRTAGGGEPMGESRSRKRKWDETGQ